MFAFIVSLLALSFLLVIHEAGHFYFAQRFGVEVEEFGLGYPPRLVAKRIKGVVYSLNAIPFGAFVKINEGKKENPQPGTFAIQSLAHKNIILLGGVLMNFLVAFFIIAFLFNQGMPVSFLPANFSSSVSHQLIVQEVEKGTPAWNVLRKGDIIQGISFQGKYYASPGIRKFQDIIQKSNGSLVKLSLLNNGKQRIVNLHSQFDQQRGRYMVGVGLADKALVYYPLWQVPGQTLRFMGISLRELGGIFKHPKEVSGPVGIMVLAVRGFEFGWRYWLFIIGIISYNLAILNLLPIPALDGGRILFLSLEKIRGKFIPSRIEELVNNIAFFLLVAILFLVTIKDIHSFFFRK